MKGRTAGDIGSVQQSPMAPPGMTPADHRVAAMCKQRSLSPGTGELVFLGLGRNATRSSLLNLVLGYAAKLYNAGRKTIQLFNLHRLVSV